MIDRRIVVLCAAAALAATACSSSAHGTGSAAPALLPPAAAQPAVVSDANLLGNGSFEKPVVPSGGLQSFNTGTSFPGWKVVGAPGNVAVVSGAFARDGFLFPSRCGKQWLDLTGNTNTATGVAHRLATSKGSQHVLTFFVGNLVDPNNVYGTSSTVNVLLKGTLILTATNSSGGGGNTMVWQKFTTGFTAPSSSVTITFLNGDPPNDALNGLDCVHLT